jgi:small GTP-binding protein
MPPELKAVLIGDAGVGKTSILKRWTNDEFFRHPASTIGAGGVEIQRFQIDDMEYTIALWDTAGQEQYRSFLPQTIRNAQVAILVFDVTCRESFQNLPFWFQQVQEKEQCTLVVAGNKVDRASDRQVDYAEALEWARQHESTYVDVSALSGQGIDDLFNTVCKEAVEQAARPKAVADGVKPVDLDKEPVATAQPCCQ